MNTISAHPSPAAAPPRPAYLDGRRILVSGASGNLGAAIGRRLARDGAAVALHYQHNAEPVRQLLADIEALGGRAVGVQGALHVRSAASQVFAEAEAKLGGIDVLVNCIGVTRDNALLMLSDEDAAAVIQGNLAPIVYLSESMRQQSGAIVEGRIINITSITGLVGQPMRAIYGAAKGAVIAYTKSLAREIAERGWTANCIAPQVVQGGLAEQMKSQAQAILAGVTPIKRPCTPEDLTGLAAFLAAPESGYVTGTVLNVTGGLVTW